MAGGLQKASRVEEEGETGRRASKSVPAGGGRECRGLIEHSLVGELQMACRQEQGGDSTESIKRALRQANFMAWRREGTIGRPYRLYGRRTSKTCRLDEQGDPRGTL